MTKHKIQNKHKAQISNNKTFVLVFVIGISDLFCALNFGICHYAIAPEPPRYEIDAFLDVVNHKITAKQKVIFTNNSDKEISEIYFHIYPHRKYTQKEIRFMYRYAGYFKINLFPEGFQGGDLKISSVNCGNQALKFKIEGADETILKVELADKLLPASSVALELDFSVDIPHCYGRFGWHKEITTLVRWYPLLSVLDKNGWHNYLFYLYHQPFFSDAAYYKVSLTLAQNQVVAASGSLKGEKVNSDGTKTLAWETAHPVRDFSLGTSKNFLIYSLTEGKTRINAYYLEGNAAKAEAAARYALDLMRYYSQNFGVYPYQEFNIVPSFLGYGGVQSSALVFIDTRAYKLPGFLDRYFDFLIAHETGHQWFYNLVGSDEYREMFLDEGMNSYWLLRYLENKYGPEAKVLVLPGFLRWLIPNFSFRDSNLARYIYLAKNGLDRPIAGELCGFQEPSSIFALTYGKGAAVIEMLEAQVGRDKFLKIMQRYPREFRFKNISLEDFIRICNEESGQDLNSFFEQWLKTKKTLDFSVKDVATDKIILENRGFSLMPVEAKITYQDGTETIEHWDGKEKVKDITIPEGKKVKQVELDPDGSLILDLDRTNNYWPRSLSVKPVPLYFFAYEIPVFLPRNSYNLTLGPTVGSSSLGLASSLQKPNDNILRISSDYDFNGKAAESKLGYEFSHVFNKQNTLGFELFNYESRKDKQDSSGGKLYLRRELWPASYGLFDLNDHITFYLVRDKKLESTNSLYGQENTDNLYYRKKDEAILGISGSLGRYGPYPDPDYGWKFIPTQEFAGHILGAGDSFWRSSLELDRYQLILPKYQHKIAAKVKLGWGESSDKKLFQLGGPDGLRGYSRKTIEGAHMILGSLEYRFPLRADTQLYFLDNILCLDKIQAVGFFDIGKAWHAEFDARGFKKDIGLGFRFHFNLMGFLEKFIVRVDIAKALNEPKEDPRVYLGINHTF